ncbi:hypothetical protein [Alkaliphilus hydrothermalis]|uniref:Uncharacterized protein n=1 Tax=Alkaliphilus hydrothermalis TaxID=1482730 RepID=A0ABS2NTZ8_9FIRM|nr:hypothetical protein [Alkaliphilus hydrothermalis]MBM7616430.1 hypothetical protein [Alkaliphilus hydrothermalis]
MKGKKNKQQLEDEKIDKQQIQDTEYDEEQLKDIEKLIKPKISTLILLTVIYISPYGHLLLHIALKEYDKLLLSSLLVFPSLIMLGVTWNDHFYYVKNYKNIAKETYNKLFKE